MLPSEAVPEISFHVFMRCNKKYDECCCRVPSDGKVGLQKCDSVSSTWVLRSATSGSALLLVIVEFFGSKWPWKVHILNQFRKSRQLGQHNKRHKKGLQNCLRKWQERRNKYVQSEGEYSEGTLCVFYCNKFININIHHNFQSRSHHAPANMYHSTCSNNPKTKEALRRWLKGEKKALGSS